MSERKKKFLRWCKGIKKVPASDPSYEPNDDDAMRKLSLNETEVEKQYNSVNEERARLFIQMFEFHKAIILLEEMPPSLGQRLMLIECYFEVGREDEAKHCIKSLIALMTSPPRPNVDDVTELIDGYMITSYNIRALVLLQCVCHLLLLETTAHEVVVAAIENCSYKTYCIFESLIEQGGCVHELTMKWGPMLLQDILKLLRCVNIADIDIRLEHEARCLNNLGLLYRCCKDYETSAMSFKEGAQVLSQLKFHKATTYKILGDLLKNMGLVLHETNNLCAAEEAYLKSLDAYGKAERMEREERRMKVKTI
uniref:uncharacterized protein LOC120336133 isoform X1 n=1 Tax=Styela clava TaxID=7725 RepID=UPI001939ADE7|nr:uncharacterized protein LOC120336133 isoform X1 [Styela clava]